MGVISKRSGMPVEGSGASKLVTLIGNYGYNPGWQCEVGIVSSVSPLVFETHEGQIPLEPEDYRINADLLPKKETVLIDGVSRVIEYPNEIKIGEQFLLITNHEDYSGETFVIMKLN